jgi:hypothetical protein
MRLILIRIALSEALVFPAYAHRVLDPSERPRSTPSAS